METPTADYFDYPGLAHIPALSSENLKDLFEEGLISIRGRKALFVLRCETVRDAANLRIDDVLNLRNAGINTVREIRGLLGRFGLDLKGPKRQLNHSKYRPA